MTTTADRPTADQGSAAKPNMTRTLVAVSGVVAVFCAFVAALVSHDAAIPETPDPRALLKPVFALVALTGGILLAAAVARNTAVFVGKATMRYYRAYASEPPAEWIERPARTYMNLLELPVLFYVVCILMIVTGRVDAAQVDLAWLFVVMRVVHAAIYLGINHVPSRFGSFVMGVITLTVIWTRFAVMS